MATSLGGFWAPLTLKTNSESFNKGKHALEEVKGKIKGFSTFALKTFALGGGGLFGFTTALAFLDQKTMILSASLRISSTELIHWKAMANMCGVSADGLVNSLVDLEKKSNRIKMGEVDMGLAKSLGMLGLGYQSFLGKSSGEKMKSALSSAMKMSDKGLAGELLRDVLGESGKELFEYLELSGQSIQSILDKAKALTFTTDQTRKGSMIFAQELKSTMGGLSEIGSLFGQTFATEFTPVLKNLQNLIIKNKQLIATNIIKFAKDVAKFGKEVFNVLQKGIPIVAGLISKFGGIENILKKVALGFGIFYGAKAIFGIMEIVKGIGLLNTLRLGGVLLGFTAFYLVLNDIATYMSHKGGRSMTGAFLNWINEMSKSTGPLSVLANSLLQIGEILKMIVFSMQAVTTGDWSNINALTKGWKDVAFEKKTLSISDEQDVDKTIDKLKKEAEKQKIIKKETPTIELDKTKKMQEEWNKSHPEIIIEKPIITKSFNRQKAINELIEKEQKKEQINKIEKNKTENISNKYVTSNSNIMYENAINKNGTKNTLTVVVDDKNKILKDKVKVNGKELFIRGGLPIKVE
jgi:hypothetical protein